MLTRDQITANIEAMEKQGASQQEIQEWLDSIPKQDQAPQPDQQQAEKAPTGIFSRLTDISQKAYEGYKSSLPVKAASTVVGGAVGALGGLIGGAVGAVGGSIEAGVTKKPWWETVSQRATETAKATAGFGFEAGAEGAAQAPLAALGKVPQAAAAVVQAGAGVEEIREGDWKQGIMDIGIGALSAYGASKTRGAFVSDEFKGAFKSMSAAKAAAKTGKAAVSANEKKHINYMREALRPTGKEAVRIESVKKADLDAAADLLAADGIVPNVDMTTGTPSVMWTEGIKKESDDVVVLAKAKAKRLAEVPRTVQPSWERIATETKAYVKDKVKGVNSQDKKRMLEYIDDAVAAEKELYGDRYSMSRLAEAVSEQWQSGGFGAAAKPDWEQKAARAFGHSMNEELMSKVDDPVIKDLNSMIGAKIKAVDVMKVVNGKVIKGGAMGRYFAKVVGATAGQNIPVVGPILGAYAGDRLATYLGASAPVRAAQQAGKAAKKAGVKPTMEVAEKLLNTPTRFKK